MKRPYIVALLGVLLAVAGAVKAQQTMLSGSTWTVGHVPVYAGVSGGQPLMTDSGLTPGSPLVTVVASLPACSSPNAGQLYVVTDALSPTYGAALTGGSTTVALALCNGSTWRAH